MQINVNIFTFDIEGLHCVDIFLLSTYKNRHKLIWKNIALFFIYIYMYVF